MWHMGQLLAHLATARCGPARCWAAAPWPTAWGGARLPGRSAAAGGRQLDHRPARLAAIRRHRAHRDEGRDGSPLFGAIEQTVVELS
jgi:hypothetical protein